MIVEVRWEDYSSRKHIKLLEATFKAVRNVPNKMGTGVFIGNLKVLKILVDMV